MKKAVVLFSGGQDSTTCLAYAKKQGYTVVALSFNYSQKHSSELEAAKRIAKSMGVEHLIFELAINQFGGSSLTDQTMAVPDFKEDAGIPSTYIPARNTIFLSIALGFAEVLQANDIFIGVSSVDYSGYPDCRPEYIAAFQTMANLATKSAVEGHKLTIHTPLMTLTKAQMIKLGMELGVDYALTVTCYRADAQGRACGTCASCTLRKNGFSEAGVPDPTLYYPG